MSNNSKKPNSPMVATQTVNQLQIPIEPLTLDPAQVNSLLSLQDKQTDYIHKERMEELKQAGSMSGERKFNLTATLLFLAFIIGIISWLQPSYLPQVLGYITIAVGGGGTGYFFGFTEGKKSK